MSKTEHNLIYQIFKGEHWKDNLSGLKWNKTLKDKVMAKHLHEVKLWRAEDEFSKLRSAQTLNEIIALQKGSLSRMLDTSCVAVLRSAKDWRIKEIGFNDPQDMFLNNWGTLLASLIHGNTGGISGYVLYDETNNARTSDGTYAPSLSNQSTTTYFTIQFGSGTTAAARNNYSIQTAFATPPESTKFQCGPGAYASGVISFGNLITAGGSGTINEISLFTQQRMNDAAYRHYMITRDILSSGVAFIAGNPLVGTFAINI
jgi:hypothetical protein